MLESRQLLVTDFGLNFTASTFQTNSTVVDPNMVGDVGTTHVIEAIVDKIAIFDRFSGAKILDKTQTQFFIDIGGIVGTAITNSQVLFDKLANRWIIFGEGAGGGNYFHVAISNTANPVNGWKATRFVGDSEGVRHNGELSVGMDADALLITSRNPAAGPGFPLSVSVYTIPKANLYQANPTLTNMSRFENLSPTVYGDYLRAASSFEASDGRATFIGNLSGGFETTRFDVVGVAAAGATITVPQKIMFNFDPFFPTHNLGSPLFAGITGSPGGAAGPVRQASLSIPPIYINNAPISIFANAVDQGGSLWFVQTVNFAWGSADSSVILYYAVTKSGYVSTGPTPAFGGPPVITVPANNRLQVGVITMPANDPRGPDPAEWDLFNPSIDVNRFGVVNINYSITSEEYEFSPTAASSTGVTVNGLAQYDPVFDTIFWTERNTQFDIPVFMQNGLGVYENNGFLNSTWSRRASTRFDPLDVNNFWSNVQWANSASRWSTQFTELSPTRLTVTITANDLNNTILIRRSAAENDVMEILMDGIVRDRLPYSVVGTVVLNGFAGADTYIIDYVNGDPIPEDGLVIDGMGGPDVIQTNDPNGARFVVDEDGGGTYNEKSIFRQIEELHGGPGNDSFTVTDRLNAAGTLIVSSGFLAGSMRGNDGDDLFHIGSKNGTQQQSTGAARIGDSILGGTGYNTLSFETRMADTFLQLLGYGSNSGYEGRSIDALGMLFGPIGGDQPSDRFFDINFVMGSLTHFDEIRQGGVGVFNEQADVLIDDENSVFVTNGVTLGFFEVNAIGGSSFVDTFTGIRNRVNPVQLKGLGNDDLYNFSSDAPTNLGSTSPLQGLLFAMGGTGNNLMNVSNRGGTANSSGLILNNRISGIGEIAYSAVGGTFALNVWTSEFADRIDLHSFFTTNTLNLFMLGGDDRISIQDLSKAFIKVYGGDGDDVYAIEKVQGIDLRNLELIDSINAERDRVTLVGTVLDETFIIDNNTFVDLNVVYVGIEIVGVESLGGNDTIHILSSGFELFVDAGDGNDVINIASDAPVNQGDVADILKDVTIEGGTGRNRLNVSAQNSLGIKNVTVYDSWITGMLPATLFYRASGGGSFSITGQTGGIYLRGSANFADVFTMVGLKVENSLRIDSLDGDDYFIVHPNALGNIRLDGGEGSDRYDGTFLGSGSRQVVLADSGLAGSNRLFLYGTALADAFAVSPTAIARAGESFLIQSALVFASLAGQNGNDTVTVTNGPAPTLQIYAGNGNDTIQINGTTGVTSLLLTGDAGNDTIDATTGLITTYLQVYGGSDTDKITIGSTYRGDMVVDGQNGSDTVLLTVVGSGNRYANLRDSGATGTDGTTISGNSAANSFLVTPTRVTLGGENMDFDGATERLTINSLAGNDAFTITGSQAGVTRINGGDGAENFTVVATVGSAQLTLDGGNNDDVFTVLSTEAGSRVTQLGGSGNDHFNVGSDLNSDNGQLDQIRGTVSADGGTNTMGGQDRLYVNDHGTNAAYSYYVGPTSITTLPGPLQIARPNFAGVYYNNLLELARLDGTALANFFSVRASQDTIFYIDGNSPNAFAVNGDFVNLLATPNDGHVLHIISPSLGSGYWDFTNGNEEVRFENIENMYAPPPSLGGLVAPGNGSGGGIAFMMGNGGNGYGSGSGGGSGYAMLAGSTTGSGQNGSGRDSWFSLFGNSSGTSTASADGVFGEIGELLYGLV